MNRRKFLSWVGVVSNEMKKTRRIPPNKRKKLKEIKKLSAIAEKIINLVTQHEMGY
jgi:hypothetical protein